MVDGRRMGGGSTHKLPAGMRSDRIVVHDVVERTGVDRVSDRYVWMAWRMVDGRRMGDRSTHRLPAGMRSEIVYGTDGGRLG